MCLIRPLRKHKAVGKKKTWSLEQWLFLDSETTGDFSFFFRILFMCSKSSVINSESSYNCK